MLLLFLLLTAGGEVLDASQSGFTSRNIVRVSAPAAEVYRSLVDDIGAWWDPDHTYSGDSNNLSLDAKAGGCFCERLAGGGRVKHMEVVYAQPGKTLRMRGGLGPLQSMGVDGAMTFSFEPSGDATQVTLIYTVGGYYPGGLEQLSETVDGVLRGQLQRLSQHVEAQSPKDR